MGTIVADLDPIEIMAVATCALCQIFAAVALRDKQNAHRRCKCKLWARYPGFLTGSWPHFRDGQTVLLSVQESQEMDESVNERDLICEYLSLQNTTRRSEFQARLLSRESFDLSFMTNCLKHCQDHHGRKCNHQDHRVLKGLRVIDCESRTIVKASSDYEYVALSYVWGNSGSAEPVNWADTADAIPLPGCPKTITDAMAVTLKLNMKYLWVDRYCINQSDETDRHSQISRMDLVCARAFACIIAAAGEGPDHGLPGMQGTPRTQQSVLNIGQHHLVSILNRPHKLLAASKWAARGWTHQEGILARRRLIFTDEQVIFECNGMDCVESWSFPLDKRSSNKSEFLPRIQPGAFMHKLTSLYPWDIMYYVQEYSQRDLTYPEDRINAMEGIFHAFQNCQRPLHHFMGIPILPVVVVPCVNPRHGILVNEQGFLTGLTWYAYGDTPGRRIPQFPSWSWAGWTSKISAKLAFGKDPTRPTPDNNVWIEMRDCSLVDFPDQAMDLPQFVKMLTAGGHGRFIHIEAKTYEGSLAPVKDQDMRDSARDLIIDEWGSYVPKNEVGDSSSGSFKIWLFMSMNNKKLMDDQLTLIFLSGIHKGHYVRSELTALVVENRGPFFERIRCATVGVPGVAKGAGYQEGLKALSVLESWYQQLPKRRIRLGRALLNNPEHKVHAKECVSNFL